MGEKQAWGPPGVLALPRAFHEYGLFFLPSKKRQNPYDGVYPNLINKE
jgi:hypothetical protein